MTALTWLISLLESGVASLLSNDVETLRLKVDKKRIDFNVMNKDLLMDLLNSTQVDKGSLLEKISLLRSVARELKDEGLTLTIAYQGALLLTLGSEAKPTFSQIVTGTDAVEINDLKQLMRIII
ncbi:MAG: hypothetical protein JSW72_07385 [Candidatus Bathyarchaeota archaeon]|nr:MAG: hypothetical protein JSW72_07385 [Candidatus Bathyarchaeota archaeon]